MFPPIFETAPPFVIRVYDTYFQITWQDAIPVPEDNYPYKNISSVTIKRAKKIIMVYGWYLFWNYLPEVMW